MDDNPGRTANLLAALSRIARGNPKGGRPISGRDAQDVARKALVDANWNWTEEKPNNYVEGTTGPWQNRGDRE
jgi:hypothetical protein